ncbi:MAG TPA: hypothetical protein VHP33_22770 [Polyangiaceae bacterium]|nr:hypothetical protein [Polyangiaceae bacterium]
MNWTPACLTLALLASWSRSALAQDAAATNAECARAYEQGQVERKSGQLLSARSTLQMCARDECPDFIRSDCANWYGEVQSEVPTLVFAARSQGRDISDVRVSVGDRVLSARVDGQVVELDPGEYDFDFRAPDLRPLRQHFVVARGERNRLIQVELEPVAAARVTAAPALARPGRSLLLPGLLVGVGAVGVAGFAGLGSWGHSQENQLESSCSPRCSDARVSEVRTKYLLADVSLGVGVASLALGAYFFFSQGSSDAQARAQRPRVAVLATSKGASLAYGGAF